MNSSVTPIDTNPMRLTHNTHCSNKKSHFETAQSSTIIIVPARKRACVMFKRPHLANENKQNHALVSRRAGNLKFFISGRATTEPGWRRPRYLLTAYTVCASAVTRTSGPSDFLRRRFTRIWTNWCGSLQFLFPRERTRFNNKKPLKWAFTKPQNKRVSPKLLLALLLPHLGLHLQLSPIFVTNCFYNSIHVTMHIYVCSCPNNSHLSG